MLQKVERWKLLLRTQDQSDYFLLAEHK